MNLLMVTQMIRIRAPACSKQVGRQAGRHEKLTNMNEDASIKILDDFGMFWH
jgi:DNA-directed RNA polymerase subunit N (RpoN/RPB10)